MKIVKLLILLPLVFAPAFTPAERRKPDQFEPIRELIRQKLIQQSVPSISVAVARGNKILWEEGFGWADRENHVPATPDTMYTLGSLAKPMTATAVMLLRQRELLNLDRPINDYLGDTRIVARIGDASGATVRHVAQHTAGLPGYYETFYPNEPDKPPPMDEVIRRYGNLVFPPGERFHYSNLDYGILGCVISRVSGKSYGDFMREEVFLPLGMNHSCVINCSGLRYCATRYFIDGLRLPDYTTSHPAAADVYSSAHDLIRFGMFHLKMHLTDQKRLLPDKAIDEMQQRTVAMGGSNSYGIGWVVGRDSKRRWRVSHGGAGAGVDTQLTLMPDKQLAVAVLINTNIDAHISGEIADAILGLLLGDSPEARPASAASAQPIPAVNSGLPGKLVGTWKGFVHTYKRDLPVTLWFEESGEVRAQLGDQPKLLVNNARLENGTFTGRMATGDIGTPDANRRPYYLDWNVVVRDEVLNGVFYAIGHHPSRGVLLGHWAELRRN